MAFDSLSDRLNKALRNVAGKGTLTDNNMEDMLKEVRLALLEADVNYRIVKEFLDEIRTKSRGEEVLQSVEPGQQLVKIVHDQIIELLGTEEAGLNFVEDGITKIMLVGLQGTGKTTSVAKIARICKEKFNKKVLLIAADVIRPAAIDQLQTLGKEIDTEVFTLGVETPAVETVRQGMEYAEKNGFDTVFIDTAGRLHIDEALMNELKDINELVHPNDILLTVDAMTGQDIVNVAQAFKDALPLTGLVVTKFDGDSRGGGVLSVKKITGVPIKFVGEGEKIEDMDIFHPDRMADRILGMGDVVTLQKLGPLGGIMKMIPGMNQYAGMLDEAKASDSMRHMKAIIQSMTFEERAHPEKMRGTMKKRVARGSGRSVDEVNKLINQFGKMKKLMDSMGNMQRNGSLNQENLEKMMGNAQKRAGQNFPNGFGGKNPFKF